MREIVVALKNVNVPKRMTILEKNIRHDHRHQMMVKASDI